MKGETEVRGCLFPMPAPGRDPDLQEGGWRRRWEARGWSLGRNRLWAVMRESTLLSREAQRLMGTPVHWKQFQESVEDELKKIFWR